MFYILTFFIVDTEHKFNIFKKNLAINTKKVEKMLNNMKVPKKENPCFLNTSFQLQSR